MSSNAPLYKVSVQYQTFAEDEVLSSVYRLHPDAHGSVFVFTEAVSLTLYGGETMIMSHERGISHSV